MTAPSVIEAVAARWRVTPAAMLGRRRPRTVADARMVAYWMLRARAGFSYPAIATIFERDHSTVIWGVKAIDRRIKSEFMLRERMVFVLTDLGVDADLSHAVCPGFVAFMRQARGCDFTADHQRPTDKCILCRCIREQHYAETMEAQTA